MQKSGQKLPEIGQISTEMSKNSKKVQKWPFSGVLTLFTQNFAENRRIWLKSTLFPIRVFYDLGTQKILEAKVKKWAKSSKLHFFGQFLARFDNSGKNRNFSL